MSSFLRKQESTEKLVPVDSRFPLRQGYGEQAGAGMTAEGLARDGALAAASLQALK